MKAPLVIILLICFFTMNLSAQQLKDHRWENRVLIIKVKERLAAPDYSLQLQVLDNEREGMLERKLVVYLIEDGMYNFQDLKVKNKGWRFVDPELKALLDPKKEFQVLLLGLDGGVKLNRDSYIPQEELFRIIDSMPMRASEMRKKKG